MNRRKYVRREGQSVVAVQLDLETKGFSYRKWGDTQRCKRGDWLVDNGGEVYTVDATTFARTYAPSGPAGHYVKTTPIWAEIASGPGVVKTKEGATHYDAGDYLVFNEADGGDGYAITAARFERLYRLAED